MNNPYINALNLPAAGVDEPFMKNEIVIGIIGNTQGVRSMANPQSIASRMSPQREPELWLLSAGATVASFASSGMLKLRYSGDAQNWSLQLLHAISPLRLSASAVIRDRKSTRLN